MLAAPILPVEILDSRKFRNIGGDQGKASVNRMCCKQQVINTDGFAYAFQPGPQVPSDLRVVIFKYEKLYRSFQEAVQPLRIELWFCTFENSVPEFEH